MKAIEKRKQRELEIFEEVMKEEKELGSRPGDSKTAESKMALVFGKWVNESGYSSWECVFQVTFVMCSSLRPYEL